MPGKIVSAASMRLLQVGLAFEKVFYPYSHYSCALNLVGELVHSCVYPICKKAHLACADTPVWWRLRGLPRQREQYLPASELWWIHQANVVVLPLYEVILFCSLHAALINSIVPDDGAKLHTTKLVTNLGGRT